MKKTVLDQVPPHIRYLAGYIPGKALRQAQRESGMTMIVVSHEMGFARQVANRVIFMDAGQIIEANAPEEFFSHPQHERTKLFLSQILH